jgi:hypothetical protein
LTKRVRMVAGQPVHRGCQIRSEQSSDGRTSAPTHGLLSRHQRRSGTCAQRIGGSVSFTANSGRPPDNAACRRSALCGRRAFVALGRPVPVAAPAAGGGFRRRGLPIGTVPGRGPDPALPYDRPRGSGRPCRPARGTRRGHRTGAPARGRPAVGSAARHGRRARDPRPARGAARRRRRDHGRLARPRLSTVDSRAALAARPLDRPGPRRSRGPPLAAARTGVAAGTGPRLAASLRLRVPGPGRRRHGVPPRPRHRRCRVVGDPRGPGPQPRDRPADAPRGLAGHAELADAARARRRLRAGPAAAPARRHRHRPAHPRVGADDPGGGRGVARRGPRVLPAPLSRRALHGVLLRLVAARPAAPARWPSPSRRSTR